MIHVVFQFNDMEVLAQAIAMDKSLEGEIVQIEDDFAVGPLGDIYSDEGSDARKQWWREVLSGGDYDGRVDNGEGPNDKAVVEKIIQQLEENESEQLWIWAAQNKHDVCGYYWLISQLKKFQGRIFILYLNNLPFINEKGHIFYPVNLFSIPPREFLKAKKLSRPVTASEFELDSEEWSRICAEIKGVRLLEGAKKLIQADYDYYDSSLRKFITNDWTKASKLIHQFLVKAPQTTGDAYLLWRLKLMVAEGMLDIQGEMKFMKDFELKLKASQQQENTVPA